MVLDILHNVIIGQPVRLDACISKGKGCAKRTYNATLCNLASDVLHTGINGTVVVVGVKCLFALFFFRIGTDLCNRRNEDGNVLLCVGKKQRKKYDRCKRRQCHRRQAKRWTCAVAAWLKPYFFVRWLGGLKIICRLSTHLMFSLKYRNSFLHNMLCYLIHQKSLKL